MYKLTKKSVISLAISFALFFIFIVLTGGAGVFFGFQSLIPIIWITLPVLFFRWRYTVFSALLPIPLLFAIFFGFLSPYIAQGIIWLVPSIFIQVSFLALRWHLEEA